MMDMRRQLLDVRLEVEKVLLVVEPEDDVVDRVVVEQVSNLISTALFRLIKTPKVEEYFVG